MHALDAGGNRTVSDPAPRVVPAPLTPRRHARPNHVLQQPTDDSMKKISAILVANDSLEGIDVAMEKAAMIEHYSGADVSIAEVVYDTIAEEAPEVLPAEQQARLIEAIKAAERNGLRNLAAPFETRIASIETRVVWDKDAARAVLQAQTEAGAELIIKPISHHGKLTDLVHTPLDWTLMRQSPCAVLISKAADWGRPTCVLAAIDAADSTHRELTREILQTAATLAAVLGTKLHVVCTYPSLGQGVNDLQVAMDYEGIKADMHDNRMSAIRRWVDELDLDVAECHVLEGKPEVVIADLANGLPATLTVLGTAARRGVRKLILGNTAESLIGRITGDIVTVREPS